MTDLEIIVLVSCTFEWHCRQVLPIKRIGSSAFSPIPVCLDILIVIEGGSMAKKILAVDDSASIRQMVSFTLRSAGYEVVEAVDGNAGVTQAKTTQVDLVLTDQNMPGMDGLTLIRTLRGLPQYAGTPILMLTTESSDAMKQQGRAVGATGWLVKPFDPQKLLEVVRKVIG
jgi:two-component system chemotaxis response regulator CheY